jgi:hypothetical protein
MVALALKIVWRVTLGVFVLVLLVVAIPSECLQKWDVPK